MTERNNFKCCFCHKEIEGYGNDPRPLVSNYGERCCDDCNANIIIPNRLKFWSAENNMYGFYILDEKANLPVNDSGLPTLNLSNVLFFDNENAAEHFKQQEGLYECHVCRVAVRKDK